MEKNFLSLIKMHRSVRAYKSEPVLSKALDVVLEAGTYAPTGGRHQSPTIIAIIDSKYRRAIAFFGAYFKVQQLIVMTVNGLIQGCLPIMRFNYGAGNRDRLHSAFRYGTALVSGMMILGTLTVILFPAQLLGLFTASESMRSFGISAMRIMAVSYLFCGWSTMISTYLQATEQVFPSMLIQLLRQFLLLISFMWGLEKLLKITGIWLSFPVTETATFVLALLIFRAGRKKETLCSGTKTQ